MRELDRYVIKETKELAHLLEKTSLEDASLWMVKYNGDIEAKFVDFHYLNPNNKIKSKKEINKNFKI